MTILRIIFANKDPLIAYHMLCGGGDCIPYKTANEFLEYLDVYEAIEDQSRKEQEEAHKRAAEDQKNKR